MAYPHGWLIPVGLVALIAEFHDPLTNVQSGAIRDTALCLIYDSVTADLFSHGAPQGEATQSLPPAISTCSIHFQDQAAGIPMDAKGINATPF